MLGAAHETHFARGWPSVVGNQRGAIDSGSRQFFRDQSTIGIRADNTGKRDFGIQSAKHVGDVCGTAQPSFLAVFPQQDDRRFLADSVGIAPDISVQDQITEDQDSRRTEPLHFIDQFV
jgi:hypothetical protein